MVESTPAVVSLVADSVLEVGSALEALVSAEASAEASVVASEEASVVASVVASEVLDL